MENSFERMMGVLRDGTGEVELDVETPQSATSLKLAGQFAWERQKRIDDGERVAYLYTHEHDAKLAPLKRRWVLCTGVTFDQARQLLTAGAKWIGPEHHNPQPR